MNKCFILTLALQVYCFILYAQKLTFTGTYQGKNIFIQNPYCGDSLYCTEKVVVNGKELSVNLKNGAYEIPLSHLSINDPVTIIIFHRTGSRPKVLNPQIIRVDKFSFTKTEIKNGILLFDTRGEDSKGKFYLYRWENENWVEESIFIGKGGLLQNTYSFPLIIKTTKYKIVYRGKHKKKYFSPEINP